MLALAPLYAGRNHLHRTSPLFYPALTPKKRDSANKQDSSFKQYQKRIPQVTDGPALSKNALRTFDWRSVRNPKCPTEGSFWVLA
jgi:hypothetical protein